MVTHYASVFIADNNRIHVGLSAFLETLDGGLVAVASSDTKLSLEDAKNLRNKLDKIINELDNA
jgi:hypothetical protein